MLNTANSSSPRLPHLCWLVLVSWHAVVRKRTMMHAWQIQQALSQTLQLYNLQTT